MLTSRQIREACELLGWTLEDMIAAAFMLPSVIDRARESAQRDTFDIGQQITIRRAFETRGVEFTPGGPQLRQEQP